MNKLIAAAIIAGFSFQAAAENITGTGATYSSPITVELEVRNGYNRVVYERDGIAPVLQSVTIDGESFEAFCLDIYQTIAPSNRTFNYVTGPTVSSSIQALYDSSYASVTNGATAAAFQLALWELTYETTSTKSIDFGTFQVDRDGGNRTAWNSASNLTKQYLQAAADYTGGQRYELSVFTNTKYQDLIVAAPVPEPTPVALLGAGLLTVGMIARRRSRNA